MQTERIMREVQLGSPIVETHGYERIMREVQIGSHTLKTHGYKLARTHMHDWLILVLLGVIVLVLNLTHPFYRFVGKDMMTNLKYPLKDNTVPVWAVPVYDALGDVICHGVASVIKEGHKSFPSGHTSWSFAGWGPWAYFSMLEERNIAQQTNGENGINVQLMGQAGQQQPDKSPNHVHIGLVEPNVSTLDDLEAGSRS
ncbi:hypothetical protein C5167_023156 [Papaver somniferum]|uniref:Phosphatidic acid phosphatase type 2/haloperoxidase domain-containing protein n=1 Tax=Papaver somniferum TaxID=3469 RepID=A0A4Y7JN43_PAPSO|nr:hypothetical protein C5167_023156 [Papaver somniferum]